MARTCRPAGRLFYLLLTVVVFPMMLQAKPATTTIADVVYGADGTPAGGVLLISWPAFTTIDGAAVGSGTESVTLGPGGALSVNLVPNVGANPANTVYTVVFQLDTGVKTEYWVVPATSPTTLAVVRTTLGASSSAAQMATRQYVDAAVAGRASDTTVVHVSGSETIAGAKQFSVAPSVPTPLQATDAVNKAYVDTALSTVGAGSYVSKTGDTMTGPLMLSGDPTAPNHAADRHYVDVGLVGKADVVNGVVPVGELGGGAADGTKCLLGNNTWGPCGGSSNAISIQNVPVAAQAPTDGQVITYEAASGSYKPKVGGGLSAGMQGVKYAVDFTWTQTSSTDLSTAGVKTLNLASCPAGVKGTEPEYWVYIAGTGTAEAAKVTGGTCNGDGQPGSLQLTTANAHGSGYTVGSASGGLQEALIVARWLPSGASSTQGGYVIAPSGDFNIYAQVSVRSSNLTADLSGSVLQCYVNASASCLFIGDHSNSNLVSNVTVVNPRGRPMVAGTAATEKPFIEVNAQETRLYHVDTRAFGATGAYFSTYVQVDDDQAFLLDGLDTNLGRSSGNGGVRCDSTVCDPVIYAPGPFNTYSAVGWLKNLNIGGQGFVNGVDWQSGNTLRITDSVIQGYAQYGVRCGTARGGYGGCELENVYEESGCADPRGNLGCTGLMVQGNVARVHGGESPVGSFPTFANTGGTDVRYYLVPRSSTYGAGNPLYAGKALTSGSGNITVLTNDVPGATSFDLLKVPAPGGGNWEVAPSAEVCDGTNGHGSCAVLTGVARATACSAGVCTFVDPQTGTSAYTVTQPPTYFPLLTLWPGSLVLASSQDTGNALAGPATANLDSTVSDIVSVMGTFSTSVYADRCGPMSYFTEMLVACIDSWGSHAPYISTFLPSGLIQNPTNKKGRLNFGAVSTLTHIITLGDSNLQKTAATAGGRPANDVNDVYLGIDHAGLVSQAGLSLGAPYSVSQYIGNVGDGTNWKEQLTASAKTFKTNVTVQGNLTVTGTCTGCGTGSAITLKTNGVNNGSQSILNLKAGTNVTLADDGSGGITIASSGGSGGSLTWPLQAGQDGTSSAPAYSFSSESTLGWYRFAAGQMGLSGDLRFNRLFSSSTSAPQTGISIGFGASDAMAAYYASSDETCGTTPCARLIRKRSGTGEAELGTHYGVYVSGPLTSAVATGASPLVVASSTLVSNLNSDMVDSAHASATPSAAMIPIADGTGKLASGWLPALSESGVTNLTADLASKLNSTGPQTFNGDLTVSGAVYANSFQSTGSGPWSVEGAYGTLTAAGTNKSKLGFGPNGKLSVSENSGAITEVAKKVPQQFTYTFFDPNNPLSMSLQVPSVYVNRASAVHVVEVYCEIDTGTATINLQTSGANILSADLACSTSGAVSTSFISGKDAIAVGAKINHVTASMGAGLHRMNIVVKYTVD
jgi:hypothetical protein